MRFVSKSVDRAVAISLVALTVAFSTLTARAARAQNTPPGADHYLVYPVLNPPTLVVPVIVSDQFIPGAQYTTTALEFFAVPVNKNNEGIIDPVVHYTWWHVSQQPFGALVLVRNQFGTDIQWQVLQPHFLLNPALKGLSGPPQGSVPPKNHYLAYDAAGPPVGTQVSLVDQFFPYAAVVNLPRLFAPPAQKIFQGTTFPILDPITHMAIYDISLLPPVPPPPGLVFALDEFGTWQLQLGPPQFLMVPSFKDGVVPTHGTSWGRLKSMYR